jgi:mRNA interferase MazF
MALFCPITSKVKGYPFEVALDEGLEIQGAILSDLVKSLDWQTREAKLIGRVSEATVSEVRAKIHTLI